MMYYDNYYKYKTIVHLTLNVLYGSNNNKKQFENIIPTSRLWVFSTVQVDYMHMYQSHMKNTLFFVQVQYNLIYYRVT